MDQVGVWREMDWSATSVTLCAETHPCLSHCAPTAPAASPPLGVRCLWRPNKLGLLPIFPQSSFCPCFSHSPVSWSVLSYQEKMLPSCIVGPKNHNHLLQCTEETIMTQVHCIIGGRIVFLLYSWESLQWRRWQTPWSSLGLPSIWTHGCDPYCS